MPLYTIKIEASNLDGTAWQALHPSETCEGDSAQEVAGWIASNQTVVDSDDSDDEGWRIRVWEGADADEGTEPAYTWTPPTKKTIEQLAQELGTTAAALIDACYHLVGADPENKLTDEAEKVALAEWNNPMRTYTPSVAVKAMMIDRAYGEEDYINTMGPSAMDAFDAAVRAAITAEVPTATLNRVYAWISAHSGLSLFVAALGEE